METRMLRKLIALMPFTVSLLLSSASAQNASEEQTVNYINSQMDVYKLTGQNISVFRQFEVRSNDTGHPYLYTSKRNSFTDSAGHASEGAIFMADIGNIEVIYFSSGFLGPYVRVWISCAPITGECAPSRIYRDSPGEPILIDGLGIELTPSSQQELEALWQSDGRRFGNAIGHLLALYGFDVDVAERQGIADGEVFD